MGSAFDTFGFSDGNRKLGFYVGLLQCPVRQRCIFANGLEKGGGDIVCRRKVGQEMPNFEFFECAASTDCLGCTELPALGCRVIVSSLPGMNVNCRGALSPQQVMYNGPKC